jgi:hypothetical protein
VEEREEDKEWNVLFVAEHIPSIYIDMITSGIKKDSGDNGPSPHVLCQERDIIILRQMESNGEVEEKVEGITSSKIYF